MASLGVKALNRLNKGRTGSLTVKKRKRRGMKAKTWGKTTPPGTRPSPTDLVRSRVVKKAEEQ